MMTRFDTAMSCAELLPDEVDRVGLMAYLRDLKASHNALLVNLAGSFNDCCDPECITCKADRQLIKAAEALK